MRPGTPDIGDPSSRRRPSSLRTPQLQILPIRTIFSPNLGRFAPQISFPDFGGPEIRNFLAASPSVLQDASCSRGDALGVRTTQSVLPFEPFPYPKFDPAALPGNDESSEEDESESGGESASA